MAISSHDADKFRLKHAEELLALFEEARGRPARSTDELARWLDSVDDDLADDIAREVAEEAGCPKASVHIHGCPTGAALALKMRPTTTPSQSTS
jgi:hypothetical protein